MSVLRTILLVLVSGLLASTRYPAALVSGQRTSGLYVDNGYDQTVVHRVVSQREKREVEHEILNLLGLPDRPPKHRLGAHHHREPGSPPQVKRSAPKFLLDVYRTALQQQQQQDNQKRRSAASDSEFDLSGQDLRAIDQSDVIMTFAAHNRHVPGVRHERGKRLWFDAAEVPPNERILGAELRLYRDVGAAAEAHREGAYTLTVYRVLRLGDGERELQYVDAVNASAGREGWLTLNLTEALQRWIEDPAGNRGIYLSVHPADRHVHELRPEDVGLVGFKGVAERQPFMVAFFKASPGARRQQQQQRGNNRPAPPSLASRRKREAGGGGGGQGKRSGKQSGLMGKKSSSPEVSSLVDYRMNPYTDPQTQYNPRTCKIQTLYVSFRDLEWQDWIIAPDGYDAYYCSGECNFPLNAHMNATNHAIVQTLVHLVNPGKVPKPCCAPTKLSPISVLYFQDESNVILKKYKNMVVKSCGCH